MVLNLGVRWRDVYATKKKRRARRQEQLEPRVRGEAFRLPPTFAERIAYAEAPRSRSLPTISAAQPASHQAPLDVFASRRQSPPQPQIRNATVNHRSPAVVRSRSELPQARFLPLLGDACQRHAHFEESFPKCERTGEAQIQDCPMYSERSRQVHLHQSVVTNVLDGRRQLRETMLLNRRRGRADHDEEAVNPYPVSALDYSSQSHGALAYARRHGAGNSLQVEQPYALSSIQNGGSCPELDDPLCNC